MDDETETQLIDAEKIVFLCYEKLQLLKYFSASVYVDFGAKTSRMRTEMQRTH